MTPMLVVHKSGSENEKFLIRREHIFDLLRTLFRTDTLLINFTDREIADTRDLNENILIELDKNGRLVSMTVEHAKAEATNMMAVAYQQVDTQKQLRTAQMDQMS